jgi:YD repeat-containing protein
VRTEYVYDVLGNRVVITNARGYTSTHTTYDALNRPVVVEDALGHKTYTRYNALGYRTVVTDANGAVTRYSYDGLNRLIGVQYPDSSVQYSYDALGRRTAMTDTLGVTTYVYDDLGRLVSVSDPLTGTVGYGYDLVGNRTQLIYPDGQVVTYTYNADNWLVQVEDWDGGLTSYAYDEAGRLVGETLPNGVDTARQYDAAGRLIHLTHTAPDDSILSEYVYRLDGVGNRTRVTETLTQTTRVITNVYDALNRLAGSEYSTGESFAYVHDAVGNRTLVTSTTPLSGTVVTTYTYDVANRLTDHMRSDGRSYTYTWSARGQLLAEWVPEIPEIAVREFAYDGAGRMTQARVLTLTTRFAYNGDGARRTVEVVGYGTTTYTLDYGRGNRILAETMPTSTVTYLYGHDCLGEFRDNEPALSGAEGWLYYLNDGAGYVRQGADESGQVVSSWLFDPDGTVLEGPNGPVSHLICGGVYDWSTGLIFRGGRYFDPTLGIWLALAPLVVVQSWRGRKKKRRGMPWYVLLLVVVSVGGMVTACGGGDTPTPDQRNCIGRIPESPPPEQIFEGYHIILACGLGSNCPAGQCDSDNLIPLQPIRDRFLNRGGEATYLGNPEFWKNIPGNTERYAADITATMDLLATSKGIFLVGHSRGATAVVWAASESEHLNLKGIALLDSYVLDDTHDLCPEYGACMDDTKNIDSSILFKGMSSINNEDVQFPIGGRFKQYPVDHPQLSKDKDAAEDIINFFIEKVQGDK